MHTIRDLERDREVSRYDAIGRHHPGLEDLAHLAVQTTGLPIAAINLMQAGTQVTVAAVGMEAEVCSREDSMCNVVLYAGHPVQVSDASKDPRWATNPFVNGELANMRFYFAHQLVSPRGVVVGTLCVFDVEPRVLDPSQLHRLERIAHWIVDILELRLHANELEQTVAEGVRERTELERSNDVLGLFASQVAHDLRGPVTAVTASLSLLREDESSLDTEQTWLLDRALGSVARMDHLIGKMLAYAAVGGRPEDADIDLGALSILLRDDLAVELQTARLVADDLPVVRGDATQFRVVLQNLVSNAVKFASAVDQPLVRISAGNDELSWWLEVADNGPGVPVEDRARIFSVMEQGDPSQEGMGMGLATCRRIVDAHGGAITMGEAPGGGALVRIVVPRTRPRTEDDRDRTTEPRLPGNRR